MHTTDQNKREDPGLIPSSLSKHAQGFEKSEVFQIVVPITLCLPPISVPSLIFYIKDNTSVFLYYTLRVTYQHQIPPAV